METVFSILDQREVQARRHDAHTLMVPLSERLIDSDRAMLDVDEEIYDPLTDSPADWTFRYVRDIPYEHVAPWEAMVFVKVTT